MNPDILLCIIKLVLGGIVAFCAILIMSKTREPHWMVLVSGIIFSYIALVYNVLCNLGVFTPSPITLLGIPISSLLSVILPSLCFIVSFLIKFFRR